MHNIAAENPWKLVFHLIKGLIESPKGVLYGLLIGLGLPVLLVLLKIVVTEAESEFTSMPIPKYEPKVLSEKEKKEFKKIGYVLYGILSIVIVVFVIVLIKRMRE